MFTLVQQTEETEDEFSWDFGQNSTVIQVNGNYKTGYTSKLTSKSLIPSNPLLNPIWICSLCVLCCWLISVGLVVTGYLIIVDQYVIEYGDNIDGFESTVIGYVIFGCPLCCCYLGGWVLQRHTKSKWILGCFIGFTCASTITIGFVFGLVYGYSSFLFSYSLVLCFGSIVIMWLYKKCHRFYREYNSNYYMECWKKMMMNDRFDYILTNFIRNDCRKNYISNDIESIIYHAYRNKVTALIK